MTQYEHALESEIRKLSEKYDSQIHSYEKKGLNPLTKKLIERTITE